MIDLDTLLARALASGITAEVRGSKRQKLGRYLTAGDSNGGAQVDCWGDGAPHVGAKTYGASPAPGTLVLHAVRAERMREKIFAETVEPGLSSDQAAVLGDQLLALGVPEWRVRCVMAVLRWGAE